MSTLLLHASLAKGTGEVTMMQKWVNRLAEKPDVDRIVILSGSAFLLGGKIPLHPKVEVRELPRHRFDYARQVHVSADGVPIEDAYPLNASERAALEAWRIQGKNAVEAFYDEIKPDAVGTIYWPCANGGIVDHETLPLLACARKDGIPTFATTRDILLADTPPALGNFWSAASVITDVLDRLYVHADPRVVALEDSFRSDPVVQPGSFTPHQASVLWDAVWEQLHSKLTYTGYMAPNGTVKPVDSDYHDNVIVATGMDWHPSNDTLVRAVMQAIPHTGDALKAKTWRLLANHSRIETMPAEEGGDAARATLAWMQDQAEQLRQKGIRVEVQDAIRELHNTMAVCGLSVQHAGGAQLLEALGLGIPFLPFPLGMDGPHYEQKTRLDLLEQQGLCVSGQRRWLEDARDGNLSATQFLADRMSEAHQRGRSECWLDMNGAQTTADAVHGLLARAKARVTGSASLAEIPASLSHQMAA